MKPPAAPLAITLGDPAGIGPEIIAKAFRDSPAETTRCVVVGSAQALRRGVHAVSSGHQMPLPVAVLTDLAGLENVPLQCIPVIEPASGSVLPPVGQVSAVGGRMAAEAVVWAAQAALDGRIGGMVTAPLHKESLFTELLQAEAARHCGVPVSKMPVRMMLANEELRTVLVSIHLSLRNAIDAVTFDNVMQTLQITAQALQGMLGRSPRMAVAGLNPHAGEGGLFGSEEATVIAPAVAAARSQGLDASGPHSPDTVFMRARRGEFDVVIAMYHDQGLIPVKYLGVEQGVNVTLGLPLVRTSPDHGTAFDIAGSGRADAASLLAAIRMARQLSVRTS